MAAAARVGKPLGNRSAEATASRPAFVAVAAAAAVAPVPQARARARGVAADPGAGQRRPGAT
eukprot:1034141-Pyramimonas_sp.AAC.1